MYSGSRARPVLRADNLTAILSRLSRQCGILNLSRNYRPPRPATGIASLYSHQKFDELSYLGEKLEMGVAISLNIADLRPQGGGDVECSVTLRQMT
jgi:hypothetical protein